MNHEAIFAINDLQLNFGLLFGIALLVAIVIVIIIVVVVNQPQHGNVMSIHGYNSCSHTI